MREEAIGERYNRMLELNNPGSGPLQSERDQLRQHLLEARAELKTAAAVREQLEERLRTASRPAPERAAMVGPALKVRAPRKRSRRGSARTRTGGSSDSGAAK